MTPSPHDDAPLHTILLVHGTFAYDDLERGSHWWQRDSSFANDLDSRLSSSRSGIRAVTVPQGMSFAYTPPWWKKFLARWIPSLRPITRVSDDCEAVFHWSGDNRETARQAAAKLLLEHLRVFDAKGPFHVIAHSHGGYILWEALRLAAADSSSRTAKATLAPSPVLPLPEQSAAASHPPDAAASPPTAGAPLPNLKSWTTVGTPFIRFKPDYYYLKLLLPALLLLAALILTHQWHADFWSQVVPTLRWHWLAKSVSAFLLYSLPLLATFLFVRAIYTLYYSQWVIRRNRWLIDEVRQRIRDDFFSSVVALGISSLLFAICWWLFLRHIAFVLTSVFLPTALATLWSVGTIVALYYYARMIYAPISRRHQARKIRDDRMTAWALFGDRSLILAYPEYDEAITGLTAIKAGVHTELLPRFPPPGSSGLSAHQRHSLRPEQEPQMQAPVGWILYYLFLPLAISRDWLFIPLYNHVFATVIDEYVLHQLHNRAFGNDVPGQCVEDVRSHPMPATADAPYEIAYCRDPIRSELREMIDGNLRNVIDSLRKELGLDYPVGLDLGRFIINAMQDKQETRNVLVHTSYFDSNKVRDLLVERINGSSFHTDSPLDNAAPRSVVDPTSQDIDQTGSRKVGSFDDLAAWVMREALKLGILFAPVIVLLWAGRLLYYPYSRDYHLSWASDTEPAVQLAINELNVNDSGRVYRTPLVVRWWVCQRLLDPALKDESFAEKIKDSRKRVFFYCKLAQKYAQFKDSPSVVNAFALARVEMGRLCLKSDDGLFLLVARSMLLSKRCLPPGDYAEVERRVLAEFDSLSTDSTALRTALQTQQAQMTYWKGEFSQLESWRSNGANIEQMRTWVTGGKASTPDLHVKRLTFVMLFARIPGVQTDDLIPDLIQALQEVIAIAKEKSPADRKKMLSRWMNCYMETIANAELTHGTDRDALLSLAGEIRQVIAQCPDERGDVADASLTAEFIMMRPHSHEEVAPEALGQLVTTVSRQIDQNETSLDREKYAGMLGNVLARSGRFSEARHVISGWGVTARIRAALGGMENELARRASEVGESARGEFMRRLALNEDVLPQF